MSQLSQDNTTVEEKAEELIEKFCKVIYGDQRYVNITMPKQCALICVDEILNDKEDALDVFEDEKSIELITISMKFWQSVKEKIKSQ